jgi:hypothetical protein
MPSANLDLVRSICAAWEHGDFSEISWAHPEIEYVIADGVEPGMASHSARWTGKPTVAAVRPCPGSAAEQKRRPLR